jgi:uncharacterized protein YkwD
MDHDRTAVSLVLPETARTNRRCLLARLAVLPAAICLAICAEPQPAEAKKGNGKKKRKGGGGKKKNKNSNGGGGGGGYAADGEEQVFLNLINSYRAQNGAGALALQSQLGAAADHHSQDMANKNYFAHSALESVKNFGYTNWLFIGENIYAGSESASSAMDAWKNSAGHNKNMLDGKFTEIGIGRAYSKDSKYGWYWTTTFGSR